MIKLLIQSDISSDKSKISGLVYHRQIVPHHYLSDLKEWQCDLIQSVDVMSDDKLKEYQAVVFLRNIDVYGDSSIKINRLRRLGIKIIFDIDDYWCLHQSHPLVPVYKKYNVEEKTIYDIKKSDLITTTTVNFAKEISKINQNVYVLPNCLDVKNEQWTQNPIKSDLIRFGWIGGMFHKEDIKLLKNSLENVYNKLDGFQICLGGFNVSPEYLDMEKTLTCDYSYLDKHYVDYLNEKTNMIDHVSYNQKYRRLWGLDVYNYGKQYNEIDVALVPLISNKFNTLKSEIKLIEAGIHNKAVIVSRTSPYDQFPENCVHYIDDNYNGWYKAIKKMINEPDYRNELAYNLSEYVKKNYDINYWTEKRKQIYSTLWK